MSEKYDLNPYMSQLPLLDYMQTQIILNEINKGNVLSDHDLNILMHTSRMKAQQIIDLRYELLKMELNNKIDELKNQEAYNFVEQQNDEVLKQFTPEKIKELQDKREAEVKQNQYNGFAR